jgi:hypothetical protein
MFKMSFLSRLVLVLILILLSSVDVFCQAPGGGAPPPPGVPIDFGLSAAIAACVGYGYHKMRKGKDIEDDHDAENY